ncbi:MAG: hypothetical protein CMJ75_16130 [Planctomycetaceae bacterium]|nr:hypothetical protein [Planctomycetaceae bacterium]
MATQIEGMERLRQWSSALPTSADGLRPALTTALQLEIQRQQEQIPVKTGRLKQSLVNPFDPYHEIFDLPSGVGIWSRLPYADKHRDKIPRPDPQNLAKWLLEDIERGLS